MSIISQNIQKSELSNAIFSFQGEKLKNLYLLTDIKV